tara:strand:- start:232 stop:579 length:348 start_codon:yes stop_codon:yes gene_type:complete
MSMLRRVVYMKKIKAIVIDPFKQQVYEKEIGQDHLPDMKAIVGGHIEAAGRFDNGDVLFVNEEGLLKKNRKFFKVSELNPSPLAGVGFVLGHDAEGAGRDASISDLDLAMKVEWV